MKNLIIVAERFEKLAHERTPSKDSMARMTIINDYLSTIKEFVKILTSQTLRINAEGIEYLTLDTKRFQDITSRLHIAKNSLQKVSQDIPDLYDDEEF